MNPASGSTVDTRFDAEKVAALRSAILGGTFRVNAALVAERLIAACAEASRGRQPR